MGPIRLDERPLLPSITSVYRPIEEYWESFGPVDVLGPDPQRVMGPLDALVLVLGLGRVGECSAIEALLGLCSAGSGRRFRLVRELGEVLVASHLGVVARHERLDADDILLRVQALFAGNLSVLELL